MKSVKRAVGMYDDHYRLRAVNYHSEMKELSILMCSLVAINVNRTAKNLVKATIIDDIELDNDV